MLVSFKNQYQKVKDVRITVLELFKDKILSIIRTNVSKNFEQLNEEVLRFLTKVSCITFIDFL